MKMKQSWIICVLFLIGSLTTTNGIERSEAEKTLISGASDSGIISTFVPDTQSSGYMLAYPLEEALGEEQEEDDHYLTAESFQSFPVIAKTQSLDPKHEALKEVSSDDKDKHDDQVDETLYAIVPDVKKVAEETENVSIEKELVNADGGGNDTNIPFFYLPLSSEGNKAQIRTEQYGEQPLKTEGLNKILGLEPITVPLFRKSKPIPETKPRPFRFHPVYPKYSLKHQQPFFPYSLRIENKLSPQFPFPNVGSGLNQDIQREPEHNKENIFVVASNVNSEKKDTVFPEPYFQPLNRFLPNSIRKTAMINPTFFRRQFKQEPIRRPHFQMKPNPVDDYSASSLFPTFHPLSFKEYNIEPFDPSHTKFHRGKTAFPTFQSILNQLGYPQRSSRLQYPQRPQPVYKPQTRMYYPQLFQPTAAQSVFVNQIQNTRPDPFYQHSFSHRFPFAVSASHGKRNIFPVSYPSMIPDENSNALQFQEFRFLDDEESMPRMSNSQLIPSEYQHLPASRAIMSQLGQYSTTVQDPTKQQIVPVFVPVPIPVPVAVADPHSMSKEESQGQQLVPFHLHDPYSEETHRKDQEHDITMICDERQRPNIFQSRHLVTPEKRPIAKQFPLEETLGKVRTLRQLIFGKYIPKLIDKMRYIPSKESTTSAEVEGEMMETFVPFFSQ
ncbi:uncharacterized protein LOC143223614 [Tachypleus tridentatus]|uniref:uncharacterized protein LOC143223614 n=1 Tax=Tachypleus tridentatus TaxID=6853 RepID=UPI003FD10D19